MPLLVGELLHRRPPGLPQGAGEALSHQKAGHVRALLRGGGDGHPDGLGRAQRESGLQHLGQLPHVVEHRVALAQAPLPGLDRQEHLLVSHHPSALEDPGGGGVVAGVYAQAALIHRCSPGGRSGPWPQRPAPRWRKRRRPCRRRSWPALPPRWWTRWEGWCRRRAARTPPAAAGPGWLWTAGSGSSPGCSPRSPCRCSPGFVPPPGPPPRRKSRAQSPGPPGRTGGSPPWERLPRPAQTAGRRPVLSLVFWSFPHFLSF